MSVCHDCHLKRVTKMKMGPRQSDKDGRGENGSLILAKIE